MLNIFSCDCWPCLLWRNVCLDPSPIFLCGLFVVLILSCMSCLYILEINLLSVALLQIFSPILRTFCLVHGFFCCAKVFKFKQAPFFYFCFYFHYSKKWVKKYLAALYGLLISLVLFQLLQLYNVLQFISMKGIFVTILLKPCVRNSFCWFLFVKEKSVKFRILAQDVFFP